MKRISYKQHTMLIVLAVLSTMLYLLDYFIIGNARDIASSFLGNLAFLPIYVIFVTLMIEQILRERERQTIMRKLNMVIGVFFSEVGNRLLKELSAYVVMCDDLRSRLQVTGQWKETDFQQAQDYLKSHELRIDCSGCDKQQLKDFLVAKRSFLVGLLENQNLLEHRAVLRPALGGLPSGGGTGSAPIVRRHAGIGYRTYQRRHQAGLRLSFPRVGLLHETPQARLSLPLLPGRAA